MTSFGNQKSRKKEEASSHQSKNSPQVSKTKRSPVSTSQWFRDVVVPEFLDRTGVVQKKHRMASTTTSSGLQLDPLRPLDDFILNSARFQLPNFADFEKWGNRVVKNLLYYQTNYFLVIGVWLVLTFVYQPKVAIYSTTIIVGSLFAARYCIQTYGRVSGGPRENAKYLLGTLLPGLALMYFMDLIVFVLFVVLVPFCSE